MGRPIAFGVFALLLLAACDEGEAASRENLAPAQMAEAPSKDPLEAAIQKAARAHAPYMKPEGDFRHGTLDHGASKDLAVVLTDPYCYAIFTEGGPDVDDLDLFLFDPTGVPVQQDSATDPHPNLGVSEPICPPESGMYRLRVTMVRGRGDYALRIYRSE